MDPRETRAVRLKKFQFSLCLCLSPQAVFLHHSFSPSPFQSFYFHPLCLCIPSFIFTLSETSFFILLTYYSLFLKKLTFPLSVIALVTRVTRWSRYTSGQVENVAWFVAQVKGVTSVLCGFHFQNEPNYTICEHLELQTGPYQTYPLPLPVSSSSTSFFPSLWILNTLVQHPPRKNSLQS